MTPRAARLVAPLAAGLLLSLTTASGGCASAESERHPARDADAPTARAPTARFVPADGASIDPATNLPARVVDRDSGVVLVLIPAGEFRMGSPGDEPERSKADKGRREQGHRRVISRPFYLAETEVTVAQFRRFADATGYQTDAERGAGDQGRGSFATVPDGERQWHPDATWRNPFPILRDIEPREDYPVVQVSWNDAKAFAAHYGLHLPSEAQWEYAARAGTTTRFPWGDAEEAGAGHANVGDEARRARFPSTNVYFPFDDGHAALAPVGRYRRSAWGLYDMIGNVEEWCEDAYGPYPPDGADESPATNPAATARILRGGAWTGNAGTSRSATRIGMAPTSRRDFQGFRVAATAEWVGSHSAPRSP